MTHEASHITNVCRYCNLYREHWPLLKQCPGRARWEAVHTSAERSVGHRKYRVETLGIDAAWLVVDSFDGRGTAILESRRLAKEYGRNYYVVMSTRSGDRKLFKAHGERVPA